MSWSMVRCVAALVAWALVTVCAFQVAAVARVEQLGASVGSFAVGFLVAAMIIGPFYLVFVALLPGAKQRAFAVALVSMLGADVVVHAWLAQDEAALLADTDGCRRAADRARAWPFETSRIRCVDGRFFATD